jgi:DNA-binding NarL/FixJ family response regulator
MLVDDQQLVTDALTHLLTLERDIAVVGVAATVAQARTLARQPLR